MENPQRGQLKDRDVVKGIPFYDVSYCMYSDWGYEKRTRIWTNKKEWINLICDKSGACGNMIESHHKEVLGNGYEMIEGKKVLCNTKELRKLHKKGIGLGKKETDAGQVSVAGGGTNRLERYRIPEDLILSLFLD